MRLPGRLNKTMARLRSGAVSAIVAQGVQAAISFVLQLIVIHTLGYGEYGIFGLLYGVLVMATAGVTGLVGDSLVVLDRKDRAIRAGLEQVLCFSATTIAVVAALVVLPADFMDPVLAIAFGMALFFFATEEIVRRLLMANLRFLSVAATDLAGFLVAIVVVAVAIFSHSLSLAVMFFAIAGGQTIATFIGWMLLPREERFLVPMKKGSAKAVIRYGSWRSLQQLLRPTMLTVVRSLVIITAGATVAGALEAARNYVSPIQLAIGGASSFLFVRYAQARNRSIQESVRGADRAVRWLLVLAVLAGVIALILAPWVGPLVFDGDFDPLLVVGWIAYGASIAVVTPYGALAAVGGKQRIVFGIRLADTVLSLVLAGAVLLWWSPIAVPLALSVGSLAGGFALRMLVSISKRETEINDSER